MIYKATEHLFSSIFKLFAFPKLFFCLPFFFNIGYINKFSEKNLYFKKTKYHVFVTETSRYFQIGRSLVTTVHAVRGIS